MDSPFLDLQFLPFHEIAKIVRFDRTAAILLCNGKCKFDRVPKQLSLTGRGGEAHPGKAFDTFPRLRTHYKGRWRRSIEAYDDQTEKWRTVSKIAAWLQWQAPKKEGSDSKAEWEKQAGSSRKRSGGEGVGRGGGRRHLFPPFTLPRVSSPFPGLRAGLL